MLNETFLNDEQEAPGMRVYSSEKMVAVRCGNSVLWLDPDLNVLPHREEIKCRHHERVRSGHDKQIRPRQQSQKYQYECETLS